MHYKVMSFVMLTQLFVEALDLVGLLKPYVQKPRGKKHQIGFQPGTLNNHL